MAVCQYNRCPNNSSINNFNIKLRSCHLSKISNRPLQHNPPRVCNLHNTPKRVRLRELSNRHRKANNSKLKVTICQSENMNKNWYDSVKKITRSGSRKTSENVTSKMSYLRMRNYRTNWKTSRMSLQAHQLIEELVRDNITKVPKVGESQEMLSRKIIQHPIS